MGNLYGESMMTSVSLEWTVSGWTSESYTKAVDNGSYTNFVHDGYGYGVAGFTFYTLKQGLLNKARSRKTSIGDMETQILYLLDTLSYSDYPGLKSHLQSSSDVYTSTKRFMLEWERPADQSESMVNRRYQFASKYYNQFSSSDPKGTCAAPAKVTWKYQAKLENGTTLKTTNGGTPIGVAGKKIVGLAISASSGTVHYAVHTEGKWLPYVTGYNWNDYNNGWAGTGKPIDAVRMYHSTATPVYRVSPLNKAFYSAQNGIETSNGQDGYAGSFGKYIDRFELH